MHSSAQGPPSEDYRPTLKRVGYVLIAAEALNLAYQLFEFFRGEGLQPGAEILFLVAGVFLVRGNLRVARIVRSGLAFLIALELAIAMAVPFWKPPDYLLTLVRIRPYSVIEPVLWAGLFLLLNSWAYLQLSSESVKSSIAAAGAPPRARWGWLSGFGLGGGASIALLVLLHGETAELATAKARGELGPSYRYFVSTLSMTTKKGGRHVEATVVKYSDRDIQEREVAWDD